MTKFLNKRPLIRYYLVFIILTGVSWNLKTQNAVEAAATAYHKVATGSNEQFLLAGKYAHALFFNGRQKEAMQLLQKNSAAKKADGQYAAQLSGIAAMNSKILDDTLAAAKYLKRRQKHLRSAQKSQALRGMSCTVRAGCMPGTIRSIRRSGVSSRP